MLRRYIAASDKAAFIEENPVFNLVNANATGRPGGTNGDNIDASDVTRLRVYISATFPETVPLGPPLEDTNPFRYKGILGYYWDDETQSYYMTHRYYAPNIGRFTQEDPIRYESNWYIYAGKNPVLYIDPWGLAHFIFYTSNRGHNFSSQAMWKFSQLNNSTNQPIYMINVNTAAAFIEQWNRMTRYDGNINGVSIFAHGNDRALMFASGDTNALSVDGRSRNGERAVHGSVTALNMVNMRGSVHLYSCNPSNLATFNNHADGHNFASALSTRVTGGSVIGYDGNVAFGVSGGFWGNLQTSFTRNFIPRLSNDQARFHSVLVEHGMGHISPLGPQQFVGGQLNNNFVPWQPPARIPFPANEPQPSRLPPPLWFMPWQ